MNESRLVYIFEDDQHLTEILQEELKRSGIDTKVARTEKECQYLLDSGLEPKAIIMDIMIPIDRLTQDALEALNTDTMHKAFDTGVRLLKEIRNGKYKVSQGTTIVVLSVLDNSEVRGTAREYGAKYFSKSETVISNFVASLLQVIR